MRNIWTIFRRDFVSYFTSPIGYIFMIVFLLLSVGLYMTSFFAFPVADMRNYFNNLPILLCVFIPAVTMRVWAEERKENTWELLLTFPMKASELVLGKFASTLAFLAITLAATCTVPLMLIALGNPDNGAILGGYLGTLLLGAMFLAIGIFFSGFCKDQIVAFVVTLVVCFALFLLGTSFIASALDGVRPGLGSLLSSSAGLLDHYTPFTRGVVDTSHVLYFVAWTALLLVLNTLYIDNRRRPGSRTTLTTAIALSVAVGFVFNYLMAEEGFRSISESIGGRFGVGANTLFNSVFWACWVGLTVLFFWLLKKRKNASGAKMAYYAVLSVALAYVGTAFLLPQLANPPMSVQTGFTAKLAKPCMGRYDLTEDKIYTISPASISILSTLDAPVKVQLYISPKDDMPTQVKTLEQDITDKLSDLRRASNGKLEFTAIHLRAANALAQARSQFEDPATKEEETDEAKSIEERMLDKGITPFQVQAMDEDQVTQKLIYSSLAIGYRDKPEEILPQVLPQMLDELEYRLINIIYKASREKKPVVAVVAPQDTVPPEMRQIYMQMGQPVPQSVDPYGDLMKWLEYEKYDVKRVELTKESPLPEAYDTLVVLNPRELNDRQRYEINRAMMVGKRVFIAVQQYNWDYKVTRKGLSPEHQAINPGINELLESYGLGVSTDFLMDKNNVPLNISSGGDPLSQLLGATQPVALPTHMYYTADSMSREVSITSALSTVFYLWGTAVTTKPDKLAELGLNSQTLMWTTDSAWTVPADASWDALLPALQKKEADPGEGQRYPLMLRVRGQFPDAYKDKPRPAWPPSQPRPGMPPEPEQADDAPETPVTQAPGELILLGCAETFSDNFVKNASNADLFMNTVDALSLGEELINVRGKKMLDRTIERPKTGARRLWKSVNYGAMSALLIAIGVAVAIARKQSRAAYAAELAREEKRQSAAN